MLRNQLGIVLGASFLAPLLREKWGLFARSRVNSISKHSRLALTLGSLLLLASCSPRDYLTRRLAGDLISDSPEFQKQQQFILQTGLVSNKDYVSPEFLALQHRGYVTATSAKCVPAVEPPPCWDVVLTPSGVETIRNLVSPEEATKPAIAVPTAKREFVSVTGLAKQGSSADVEFTWKWTPLNEIGAALYSEDHRYRSLVGFRQFDDGWRILESATRSGQSLGDALKNADPAQ